jgi:uncharacterized membrane protein YqjE
MDKLSIYELLSFIIPGYVATRIVEYYLKFYNVTLPFPMEGKMDENLHLLVMAIILGVAIHVLTFKVISHPKLKWMKSWIYKPEDEYIENSKGGELPMIMDSVLKMYEQDKDHTDKQSIYTSTWKEFNKEKNEMEDTSKDVPYYNWTFDFAYYYLEVNDKITQAKNFQSFYFLFRNLFVMSMVHFVLIGIMGIVSWFVSPRYSIINPSTGLMVLLLIMLTWLIIVVTNWLRGKMIDRVFWSYYMDRQINKIDNQNKK